MIRSCPLPESTPINSQIISCLTGKNSAVRSSLLKEPSLLHLKGQVLVGKYRDNRILRETLTDQTRAKHDQDTGSQTARE